MSGQGKISTVFYGALALALTATTSARAEGEFMRDAMSKIGLIEPERPAITYRERAPLVMPPKLNAKAPAPKGRPVKGARAEPRAAEPEMDPTLNLPIPRSREADPQWPKDPEIVQRQRAAAEDGKPIVRGTQGRMNDNNMTLSATEMQGGRKEGAQIPTGPVIRPGDNVRESTWLNPLQLLTGRKDEAEPSAVEPEREGLTDPPTGYRKAPIKAAKAQAGPVGGSISGNEEADPRAYMRSQNGR